MRRLPVSATSIVNSTILAFPYALPSAFLGGPLIFLAGIVLLICPPLSIWVLIKPGAEMAPIRLRYLLLLPYILGVAGYLIYRSSSLLS